MRMRCLALAAVLALASAARAGEPIALKVLYAGNPGSDRERDFQALLGSHFLKVGTADYRKFTGDQPRGYDVVIFDWTSIYPREKGGTIKKEFKGLNKPKPPRLTQSYSRPTVLIGAAGGFVANTMQLKIDWL